VAKFSPYVLIGWPCGDGVFLLCNVCDAVYTKASDGQSHRESVANADADDVLAVRYLKQVLILH